MRRHAATLLLRLAKLDAALASPEGLTLQEFAVLTGIEVRTLRRDIQTLRALGREIPPGDQRTGFVHIFRYADGTQPVFSKEFRDCLEMNAT